MNSFHHAMLPRITTAPIIMSENIDIPKSFCYVCDKNDTYLHSLFGAKYAQKITTWIILYDFHYKKTHELFDSRGPYNSKHLQSRRG